MATNDDSLMFSVLGCFEMRAGGRLVEIRGATAQRLLGVLLLYANTWVHESRLVDLTWGGANATRNALHCAVARLRRALAHHDAGSVRLQRSDAGYRMEVTADQLDAPQFLELRRQATAEPDPGERFELLLRGLGLWRGQVLADTGEWLRTDPNVLALERARLDCVYEAADLGLARGEAARVLPLVEQLVPDMPYDEPLHAHLINMLGAVGRRAEGLRSYERIRVRLAGELGVDPSTSLQTAHLALLDAGSTGVTEPHPAESIAAPAVPAQLPPAITDFVGRTGETRRIVEVLTAEPPDAAVPLVVISGRPGVGKSALTVRAAHLAAPAFPDGQLYAHLGGTPASRETTNVLASLLRSLGVANDRIPDGIDERAALYRSCLARRRVLVVLDDVVDNAQARYLLPGSPGCAVIVSGVSRLFALEGACRVELDVLDPADAIALLASGAGEERVRREPEAAKAIVARCGYLPLGIRAATARLADRPYQGLRWLADLLGNDEDRLAELSVWPDLDVRDRIGRGYAALGHEDRRLFHKLSRMSVRTVDAEVAADVMRCSVRRAERLLDKLCQAYLLAPRRPDHTGRTLYHLDCLVSSYGRERRLTDAA